MRGLAINLFDEWAQVLGATVVQEVKKSVSNQKVASSIPLLVRSVLEQDTEPLLIAPDVQCAISVKM